MRNNRVLTRRRWTPPVSPRSGRGTHRLIRWGEPTGLVPRGPRAAPGRTRFASLGQRSVPTNPPTGLQTTPNHKKRNAHVEKFPMHFSFA